MSGGTFSVIATIESKQLSLIIVVGNLKEKHVEKFTLMYLGREAEQAIRDNPHWPRNVPWGFVAPYDDQAKRNHSQSLETLNRRGGLAPQELLAVIHGKSWREFIKVSTPDAVMQILDLLGKWEST